MVNHLTFKQWKIKSGLQEANTVTKCKTCNGTGMIDCNCMFDHCVICEDNDGEVPCPECDQAGKRSNLIDLYEEQRRHDAQLLPKLKELTGESNKNG